MPRVCLVLGLIGLLLAGCSTHRAGRDAAIEGWQADSAAPELVTLPPELTPRFPTEPTPPPSPTPAPPATNAIVETWLSFDRWCRERSLPLPFKLPGFPASFASDIASGRLVLAPDSLIARWNGIEVRLGFAPRVIDNKLFIHGIDAQKTLLTLAQFDVSLPRTRGVLVIDPGHGGENAGARSVLGEFYEKMYTLDWAKRLALLLEAEGWRVVLTRTNDQALTLPERVAVADREQADLFISLHFNSAAPNETQGGLETYCLTPTGLPSSLTREYDDDLQAAFPNNVFDADNLRLAVRLHRALLGCGLADRGVRHARFMGVLRGQNRPAVLLEGGYLSNPTEAKRVATPEFRQQLAEAVARALRTNQPVMKVATQPDAPEVK